MLNQPRTKTGDGWIWDDVNGLTSLEILVVEVEEVEVLLLRESYFWASANLMWHFWTLRSCFCSSPFYFECWRLSTRLILTELSFIRLMRALRELVILARHAGARSLLRSLLATSTITSNKSLCCLLDRIYLPLLFVNTSWSIVVFSLFH